jgi:hypothetical protein
MMFLATALLYPCVLALLCIGAALLVDRLSGSFLPGPLLASVGAATQIALSQLTTYVPGLAPATPYAMAVLAIAGLALSRSRALQLARAAVRTPLGALGPILVYTLALAPVLVAGRASFSSFQALADSAVHLIGADYLIHHGQSYAHLDLRNSYGQFIDYYYNSSYPSGADTLFGGSALLLRLPLIWAFQPFNAFMLATAFGPAWLLARRLRLPGAWATLAALTAVLPAIVYAYELLGSVKEVTALSMLLASGSLVTMAPRWLPRGVSGGVPLALVLAGGMSALGVAFGVWALAAVAVVAALLLAELHAKRLRALQAAALAGVATLAGLFAALPTFSNLSGSLQVATNIASTSNPGNLRAPLRAMQVLGIWLGGSYKLEPAGSSLQLTHALIVVALIAAVLGAVHVLRIRAYALAGWLALTLLAWLAVKQSVTTWAGAKTLMLTSPVVMLLAWGGVAALRTLPARAVALPAAALLALAIAGGVLVSDALQYRSSNLAPTARYQEMASLNSRFAHRGPTLFSDFDEYSLYELRALDIGGPDFVYPPPALAAAAGGYGNPVDLGRVSPQALLAYPLIITRRSPTASRPPAAYRLAWQGAYYQVWQRAPGAPAAVFHLTLSGTPQQQCTQVGRLLRARGSKLASRQWRLIAAPAPAPLRLDLLAARRPAGWGRLHSGLAMKRAGRLSLDFQLPTGGVWQVWVQGQIMPTVTLGLDGHALASIGGELSGNSLVVNTAPPRAVRLAAGSHTLTVTRHAATLAPGEDGANFLDGVFLTRAAVPASPKRGPIADPSSALEAVPAASWQRLCATSHAWVELLPPGR